MKSGKWFRGYDTKDMRKRAIRFAVERGFFAWEIKLPGLVTTEFYAGECLPKVIAKQCAEGKIVVLRIHYPPGEEGLI